MSTVTDRPGPSARERARVPRPLVALAACVLTVGLLVMLWPVLTNPIQADDRYWYLDAAGLADGSYLGVIAYHLDDLDRTATSFGRVIVLAFTVRSLSMLAVTDLAVWSATPFVAGQAMLKVVLLGLIALSIVAFLRVLRHRLPDGSLGRLSWRTVWSVLLVAVTLTAAGAQAHGQHRNGWTSYAVQTWGIVVVILGSVALLLWLARRAAGQGRLAAAAGLVGAVLVALFLNVSYELFYVAVPLIVVVLAQQPLIPLVTDADRRAERRTRLLVGGGFVLSFGIVFVALRAWIAQLCSQRSCYAGSELDLGPLTLLTATRNLLTAVPLWSRTELRTDLREAGIVEQMPGWATPGALLVAGLTSAALVVLVMALTPVGAGDRERRTEASLLTLAAAVPTAAAVGTALIMALSSLSHEIVVSVGSPYRNTMVTWAMLALTAAMLLVAVHRSRPRSLAPPVAGAVLVTLLAAHTVAGNYPALRASWIDPGNQAVAAVHREVVVGDPSPEGEARRCQTLEDIRGTVGSVFTRGRILAGAESAYQHYHGASYCSESTAGGG